MSTIYTNEPINRDVSPLFPARQKARVVVNWLGNLGPKFTTLAHNWQRRRKFIALLNYDDHIIDDMGLTRDLIEAAIKLPLSENAAVIAHAYAKSARTIKS